MSVKTTWKCDRRGCRATTVDRDEWWSVTMPFGSHPYEFCSARHAIEVMQAGEATP